MGCCLTHIRIINEFPYEDIDGFNKLKNEINYILNNKENINHSDNKELLELINKISIKIAKCQEIIENLKTKRRINPEIINEIIQGIKTNVKELKEYNIFLNNQIKINKNVIKIKEILEEEIKPKEIVNGKTKLIIKDKSINNNKLKYKNNLNLNQIKPIYYKKFVRRNKNNFNKTINPMNSNKQYLLTNFNCFNNLNNGIFHKTVNLYDKNMISMYDYENKINIIFELENGKKIAIDNYKNDTFLNAINKLGEKVDTYNNIENMIVMDGNNDITDKIIKGEIISEFQLNDYHLINITLKTNKKES